MNKVLYRKNPRQLRMELREKFPSQDAVVFKDCPNYRSRVPTVTVRDDHIEILGSEYQIFNMKRYDLSHYWDYFYKSLGIEVLTEEPK